MAFGSTKAPFPWFGGKNKAAPAVWEALGDVDHYVEPFAGSLAVLLGRPHEANRTYHSETVNDADGLLVNAWRSIQWAPDATAEACSWPVSELDQSARHIALVKWREECNRNLLAGSPEWHDPKMAGWWLWGVSCWIGGGWCDGLGPWTIDADGRLFKQPPQRNGRASGVSSRLPHLGDNGRGVYAPQLREPGVSSRRPHLSNNGQGVNAPQLRERDIATTEFQPHDMTMPKLRTWFRLLSARLRHVRIISGDWSRLVTTGATKTLPVRHGGVCGVFLDPPYADTAGRAADLYGVDCLSVAHKVRDWCLSHGDDPQYRIVLAGFDGEHGTALEDAGWRAVEWFTKGFLSGGMGNLKGRDEDDDGELHQQKRERLWLSPHCLKPKAMPSQRNLFGDDAA